MPVLTTRSAEAAAADVGGGDAFTGGTDGAVRKPRRVSSAMDLSTIDARSAALIRAFDVSFSSASERGAPAFPPPAPPAAARPPPFVPPLAFAPPPVAGGVPWSGDVEACLIRLASIGVPPTLLESLRGRLMSGSSAGAGSPALGGAGCRGGSLSDGGGAYAAAHPTQLPF